MALPLIEVRELRKHFAATRGLAFARSIGWIKAVDGVDFQVQPRETLTLVGESGCGKTTTARCVLGLETKTSGSVLFEGKEVTELSTPERRRFRASVQAVFQDPYSSLNPRWRVKDIVSEPIVANETVSRTALAERVELLLQQVGLNPATRNLYPHEFSGGQRQRIAVARALAVRPRLIVLDEPVSALDVSIRAQTMNLLKDLQQSLGLAYLLIAHDLSTVRYMSTWVAVMYLGKVVEMARAEEFFTHPLHPYARALLSAALPSHPRVRRVEVELRGEVSSPLRPPSGCAFHPRCPESSERCAQLVPRLQSVGPDHTVACHLHAPAAGA